jgi:serine/threonine protein kinase
MNFETGQIIADRFRIEAFLGKGGMAEVYKVTDVERSAFLALKMLREELAEDVVFLRRFKREAQTLARLQHPYIVRFYGLEQTERQAFILMDYVEGTTLRKEIFRQQTPFPLERIVEISRAVCSALSYAHNQGLVHCDIKPANIMLNRNGNVVLTDFGIARMTESATSASLSGAGTPAYMAPEQVRGEIPTPQTDIYSYGIVLYEIATGGDRPFTGENADRTGSTIEKVEWEQLFLDPPPPSLHYPQLQPGLEAIILKCLQKDPKDRPQSTLELLNDLEHLLMGEASAQPDQENSLTYVPGEKTTVPEETASIISNSNQSTSKTPARRIADAAQTEALAAVPAVNGNKAPQPKIKGRQPVQPKKRAGVWISLLVALLVVGILGSGAYFGINGFFGEIPILSSILTPAPAVVLSTPIATLGPSLTPSPISTIAPVSLTSLYENKPLNVSLNIPEGWTVAEMLDTNGYGQVSLASEGVFDLTNLPDQISLAYLFFIDKASIGNASNITNDPASLLPVANGFIQQVQDMLGANVNLVGDITPHLMGFFPAAKANLKFSLAKFAGQGALTVLLADNRIIVFLGVSHESHWIERQPLFDQMIKTIKIKPAKATITPTVAPSTTPTIFIPTQQLLPTATPTTKIECGNVNGTWSGFSVDSKGNRQNWSLIFSQVGCYLDVFISSPYNTLGQGQVFGNYVSFTTTFNKVQKIFQFSINHNLLEGYDTGDSGSSVYLNFGN